MLCFTSYRQRGHLETAPPFTVPCEGREGYEPLNRVCLSAFVSGDVTARAYDWLRDYLLHLKMIIFLLNQMIILSPNY